MSTLNPNVLLGSDTPSATWSSGTLTLSLLPSSKLIYQYSTDPNYASGDAVSEGVLVDNQNGAATTAVIQGLTPGTTYWFVITTESSMTAEGIFSLAIPPAKVVYNLSGITPNTLYRFRARIDNSVVTNADTAWLTSLNSIQAVIDELPVIRRRHNGFCFMVRLETLDNQPIVPSDVESITYTVFQMKSKLFEESETAVTGHQNISVNIFPSLLKQPVVDYNWTVDTTGYNFIHSPSSAVHDPFPEPGFYKVQYTFVMTSGESRSVLFQVHVIG